MAQVREVDSLTEAEGRALLMSALLGAAPAGLSEDELGQVADWAHGVRMDQAMLELVLRGEVLVSLQGGELLFRKATETETQRVCDARDNVPY